MKRFRLCAATAVLVALAVLVTSSLGGPTAASAPSAPATVAAAVAPAAVPGTVQDSWSTAATLRTPEGWYASPVHATLLPDGRVLMFGLERSTEPATSLTPVRKSSWIFTPNEPGESVPAEVTTEPIAEPVDINELMLGSYRVEDDLFCAGHTLTADGKVFTTGGNRRVWGPSGEPFWSGGLEYSTMFDPQTDSWTRLPGTLQGTSSLGMKSRWYPSATRLSDGRILIQGGFDRVIPSPVWQPDVEIWDPATNSYGIISSLGRTPFEIFNSAYTHAFVLPTLMHGRNVIEMGEPGVPVFLGTSNPASWRVVNERPRPGSAQFQIDRLAASNHWNSEEAPNFGASTSMLPLRTANRQFGYFNGTLLVAGGPVGSDHVQGLDIYDPVANVWAGLHMLVERSQPDIVDLPDGRELIIGGGGTEDPALRHAEYLDPRNGYTQSLGTADGGEVRGYHKVSLLLPDGRVLVGGGRDIVRADSLEKPSFRYYEPDYMDADRPEILDAPSHLASGAPFIIQTDRPVSEVVAISLGSQTHSYDMNQRSVQLPLLGNGQGSGGTNLAVVGGPPGPLVLPAGHYMLFALDAQRVPSVATMVQVVPS